MNTTQHATEPLAADAPTNGHDANGRFTPGNPGGPGNPFARRVAELREVMLECVTDKEMEIIVGALMVQAMAGKLAAIKLLFQYVLGKPPATVEPDTLDLQEVEQYRQAPQPAVINDILGKRLPADYACNILRSTLPYVSRSHADALAEGLLRPDPDGDEDDADLAAPATRPAPSANGDFCADARQSATLPPQATAAHPAPASPKERIAPCQSAGG